MVDIVTKWRRVKSLGAKIGLFRALKFELAWTMKLNRLNVSLPGYPNPLSVRRRTTDLCVFTSTFVDEELAVTIPTAPALVIDGGANVGYTTAYYAKHFPKAIVVAVEPSSENLEMLRINCASFDNIHVIAGGLWSEAGILKLENPDAAAWSFRCVPARSEEPNSFRGYTLQGVMNAVGVERCDLLKLDIEGAELELFRHASDWMDRVDRILVEVHGEAARAAVEVACDPAIWDCRQHGEKLLIIRRDVSI